MIKINRRVPTERIKLLIFDLDGTLIDSRLDLANSVNAMLRKFGRKDLPIEVIATYVGDGAPTLVQRALGDGTPHHAQMRRVTGAPDARPFVEEALDYFLAYYREHKLDNTHVYAGVMEALAALGQSKHGRRRSMAVLSNKPVNPTRQIAEALGLTQFFSQIYGGNSFSTKKPDPQGARRLLEENHCAPQEALLIGDTDVDILTARNAGLWSCGVSYGFAPHTLKAVPPDVLADSAGDWVKLLIGM